MSENIITKVDTILALADAGIKHDSSVLLNVLKELFADYKKVANGIPYTAPEIPLDLVIAPDQPTKTS